MEYPSKIIESAVVQFSSLPGIGKKTALRLVLHLVKQSKQSVLQFSQALKQLTENIKFCAQCHVISDNHICEICNNPSRNNKLICIVKDYGDVIAIENTGLYKGLYHVLGGIISPMDGVGPQDLNIDTLLKKLESQKIDEVIFAINATMEGETTCFYLAKKITPFSITISSIARGIAVGDELEYTDEITLGRSIQNRVLYK